MSMPLLGCVMFFLCLVVKESLGFVGGRGVGGPISSRAALRTSVSEAEGMADVQPAALPGVCGMTLLATAAAGLLARSKRQSSKVVVHNYGGFKPVVGDRYQYTNDVGYLADGTPISTAGNNSLRASTPAPKPMSTYVAMPSPVSVPVTHVTPPSPPLPVAQMPVASASSSGDAWYGIKSDYSKQKDAYADLEFLNDVGYLPDGTPMNKAGNCINHPETIQPDPHTPGTPLPRANLHNSVGYLPDGTAMNAAGNAVNHPERMQPDMHVAGSPLPKSVYYADAGYFVDGTDLTTAGNNFSKVAAPPAASPTPVAFPMRVASAKAIAASFVSSSGDAWYGVKSDYSKQKDAYADLEFLNDVGYLPDGTPMNKAGNCINHPETIQPDPHTPGTPLPRANLHNSVGYLPDGTAMNAAGNAVNHPERMQPDMHVAGSPLPKSVFFADTGYFVDGTDLTTAGNNFCKVPAVAANPTKAKAVSANPFVGTSAPTNASNATFRQPSGFAYSTQKDVYADFLFSNDVGYLPDGTAMNKAGNAMNHPEKIQEDPHTNGSPLPRANFANDVGYLPDGTPMNRAGNALNHPERLPAESHTPGSALPCSAYAADVGYLVDGTPLDAAGNKAVH